jgi:hypothetical protein
MRVYVITIGLAVWFMVACTLGTSPGSRVVAGPDVQITATSGPLPIGATQVTGAAVEPVSSLVTATFNPTEPPPTLVPEEQTEVFPANFIGPETYPENVNPLTGLVVDPAALSRRPIIAKVSNAPPLVRPQAGIGRADHVWEHYAEGGLTRFSAVFYGGTPERVGSIRSGRLIDYELAPMYQGLLVFSGGSTGVEEQIYGSEAIGIAEARLAEGREIVPPSDFAERAFKGVLYGPPFYFRDERVPVPHNLFATPADIWGLASSQGVNAPANLRGLAFTEALPEGALGAANVVDVRYRATRAQWFYNAEAGHYERMSDGQWHTDSLTGERVSAENVVVIFADHSFSDIAESEWQGNRSYGIHIKLWFEGEALVARDGQWYRTRWERPTRESLLYITTEAGGRFPLKPGQTFYQAVRLPEQQDAASEWVRVE